MAEPISAKNISYDDARRRFINHPVLADFVAKSQKITLFLLHEKRRFPLESNFRGYF